MTRRLLPLLLGALLVLSGCVAVRHPGLADGPLVQKWRLPAPLPAPAGRQWAFTDPTDGFLGEGRRLASIDLSRGIQRWSIDVPARYAITSGSVTEGESVLLLHGTPASTLAVSAYDGHTLWEQAGGQAIVDRDSLNPHAFIAACAKAGCDLTARDQLSGKVLWRRHIADQVSMTAGAAGMGGFYLLGTRTLSLVDVTDGRIRWTLPRSPGPGVQVLAGLYRAIIFTPPARPGCTATFRGVDAGKIVWTYAARWHDAGALRAPCTYDPARLMVDYDGPELPVEGALVTLDSYHGTTTRTLLDPGEYLLAGGSGRLTWTPGIGYRSRDKGADPKPAAVPPPVDGRPWAEGHAVVWLLSSGHGVILYRNGGGIPWAYPTPTPAMVPKSDLLVYLDGDTLTAVGPEEATRH